jgi:hypothetical protein
VTFLGKWFLGGGNTFHTELFEKRFHNHTHMTEGVYNVGKWNNTNWIFTTGRNFDRKYRQYVFRQYLKPNSALSLSYAFNRVEFVQDPNHNSTYLNVLTGD